MKIGVQLYTLRNHLSDENEIRQTLKKIKDIGYNCVQLSGVGKLDVQKARMYKNICDELDIEIIVTHVGFDQLKNSFSEMVEVHKILGCNYIGIGMMPRKIKSSKEDIEKFAIEYNDLASKYQKEGFILTYHNHYFEYKKKGGKLIIDILKENFNNVQFLLDVFWIEYAGFNSVEWINKVQLDIIHLKDMKKSWPLKKFAALGDGCLDFKEIMESSIKSGVKYGFVEIDNTYKKDPFDWLNYSYKHLVSLGYESNF